MQFSLSTIAMAAAVGFTHAVAVFPGGTAKAVLDASKPTPVIAARQTTSSTITALTVRVINNAGVDIMTRHAGSTGAILGAGASGQIAVGSGASGAIFVSRHDLEGVSGHDSQIEYTYMPEDGKAKLGDKPSLDVS
ncbi:hypothetical protein B0T14DRAFT_497424 [Immersiella caudata]|uniref:Uncharacterized protein n=1 Tax=Immersiella caudata TaxID=314043 RepID=A0AA39WSX3_9PEZI|nr:hypothetical protein B0T14DRAFT_497424 [Immersiella caudata]